MIGDSDRRYKPVTDYIPLLDWRRSVAKLYGQVRASGLDLAETWRCFRMERDQLFRSHPQSPLCDEQKTRFTGLRYYWDCPLAPSENRLPVAIPAGEQWYAG